MEDIKFVKRALSIAISIILYDSLKRANWDYSQNHSLLVTTPKLTLKPQICFCYDKPMNGLGNDLLNYGSKWTIWELFITNK